MNTNGKIYNTEEERGEEGDVRYFFVSQGNANIIKIIDFSLVGTFNGGILYNLGFGDYDSERDEIVDDICTNNGDVYVVFNTVLSAIPKFFEINATAALMVGGSDSREEFVEKCRRNCKRRCGDHCKGLHRRIGIYTNYIDKYFKPLTKEYAFWGEIKAMEGKVIREMYQPGAEYDIVYVAKKVNLAL